MASPRSDPPLIEGRPPLVVIVAGAPFSGVRRSARSVADAMAAWVDVLYVDPPTSPLRTSGSRSERLGVGRPTLTSHGRLHHLSPVVFPAHTRWGTRTIVRREALRAARGAIAALDVRPALVLQQSLQLDLLGALDESCSIVWATDAYRLGAGLMGMSEARVGKFEERVGSSATMSVAVTEIIANHWRTLGIDTVVVPNGVDPVPTVPAASPPHGGPIRAVVAGTLSPRLDFALLQAVVDSGIELRLVGPAAFRSGREVFDALVQRTGVDWMGQVDHTDLPRVYAEVDVGLLPYTLTPFNQASFPLKPLEYLAAGLPTVSTDLPAVRDLGSPDIEITSSTVEFTEAIHNAAPGRHDPDRLERRTQFAAAHSWERSARAILSVAGLSDHVPS